MKLLQPAVAAASLLPVLVLGAAASAAADPNAAAGQAHRPRVGLVLGGGGAMGAAHVGVIKVLEELHVPVDCIAGTSMGALIGGAYASGMSGAEIERFITSIDWQAVFSLEQVRAYQPMSVKRESETISNKLEFGVGDGGLIAPRALVETQQVESLIRSMVASQSAVHDFDKLPIPFRAVATDLKSGQMVVFRNGELPVALRASMSVPGAFPPVEVGDWLLVDGGITRNLPVDVAREACADVVIAVALHKSEPPAAVMRSATGSLTRMVDILIANNERVSFDSLGPQDVGLSMVLDGIGSTDFYKSRMAIEQGERAARSAAARLASLSVPAGTYAAWRDSVEGGLESSAPLVADVRIDGVDDRTARYLRSLTRTRSGDRLDETIVADDALRIYATGAYESVAHRVEGPRTAATVVFTPRLKSWGPTFVAFDFGLESSLSGQPEILGSALLRRTWPQSRGQVWRALGQLGGETLLESDLRLPFGPGRRFFLLPRVGWYRSVEDLFAGDEHTATYEFRSTRGELRLGFEMGTWGELQAGIYRRADSTLRQVGALVWPVDRNVNDAGFLFEFERDTRDSDLWSTHGSRQRFEFTASDTALGASESYETALFEWNQSAVFRRNALVFGDFAAGTGFGSAVPPYQTFRLGGPGAMTGLQRGQWRGEEFVYGRLGLGWRLSDVQSLLNMDLFAGLAMEAGNAWRGPIERDASGLALGAQLFVGGNTPFGPVQLTGGYLGGGEYAVYLSLGRPTRSRWR